MYPLSLGVKLNQLDFSMKKPKKISCTYIDKDHIGPMKSLKNLSKESTTHKIYNELSKEEKMKKKYDLF